MSQVIIAGDTSGTITLQAPAVAGSSVLTLPATTATLATLTTPSFASTIGVGGATASASGAGISFPATINASSDANTLDDYEEGTWSPTVTSGSGSITSYTATGSYTKIGRTVTLYGNVQITNPGTAGGDLRMNSVPFNSLLSGQYLGVCRETTATGVIYYPNVSGSQLSIQSGINGAVIWATNYRYETINTYTTT
jgi:hypothetical protein